MKEPRNSFVGLSVSCAVKKYFSLHVSGFAVAVFVRLSFVYVHSFAYLEWSISRLCFLLGPVHI